MSRLSSANFALLAALACAAAASCYSDEINSVSDVASVTTLVDSQTPLKAARTFTIPDTVVHIDRDSSGVSVGHGVDTTIVARIRADFAAKGWREIRAPFTEKPDVVVLTALLTQTRTGVAYSGWWSAWGWYPGWPVAYGDDWSWGIPAGAVEFTYESGTLLITMIDVRNGVPATKHVPLLWAAGVSGVLTTQSLNGALAGIDQAFAQSPYLQRQ